ncbi:hypothetical protein ACPW96_09100 [Micromonospora sp. DT81.3]|uniref:hypothetical protein n=1 Tax=Micromonospora sp. DT81.3 TaxID=3416523 RepID=UPI003CF141B2
MDAPRGSVVSEQADELERLRRRAYGPEADIAGDAAAQARLSELEAAQRRQPTRVGDAGTGVQAPIPERVPVVETVEGWRSASTSVHQAVGGAFAEQERAATSFIAQDDAKGSTADSDGINRVPAVSWWRRSRSLIVGAAIAALVLNVTLTAGIWQLLADQSAPIPAETATAETPRVPAGQGRGSYVPAPDRVLALRSDGVAADQPKDPGGKLDVLGISPDGLKRYEDFESPVGSLSVWSGESRFGMTCVLMAAFGQPISDGGRAAEGCSLKGADTIADIMGSGSLTRLVLRGDHINVYVYQDGADPNASQG